MRKVLFSLVLVLVGLLSYGQVRIFEVYGGGGASTGTPSYTKDYVVLYNPTSSPINLAGWSLQYNSATSTTTAWQRFIIPSTGITNIPANGFFLIAVGAVGTVGSPISPTPDQSTTSLSLSATAGKLALFDATNTGAISTQSPSGSTGLQDFVGYGTTANASETSPAPAPANTATSLRRNSTGNDTNNNSIDFSQVSNPVPFNSVSSPLPITLISFKASLNSSNQAVLKWATASEKDNHYFEIERSKNAIDFESLGKMNGKGTSDLRNDYAFTDETPLKGINYYRLKQVDFDGTFSYTRPESVITEGDGSISLYPNPTVNVLKINFEDLDQIETATIYNQSGVLMKNLQGSKSSIDIQELPQGKYILQIRLADQRIITNSFVKF
ncbi:MAG: lamin tail domain-containing protein [Arcicella sp.]|jgi:hypothetical protein|nr:lamin tail domain-containing protein [Arcicella sp.]